MTAPVIVVGLDDTPSARAALRWAARQARLSNAIVRAVHVLDWEVGISAFGPPSRPENPFLAEAEVAFSYRRGVRRNFEEADPPAEWSLQFAEGDVGPVLVHAAEGAAMLVIGCRTWTGFNEDLAGPVAHYCLSNLRTPVVVVPEEDPTAGDVPAVDHPAHVQKPPRLLVSRS